MANYYYLIAGLPDISFDGSKAPVTLESFRSEVYEALSGSDRKVMDLLLLENDCRNLITLLGSGSVPADAPRGLLGTDRMEEVIAQVKAQDKPDQDIPRFIYTFIEEWQDESWRMMAGFAEDRLWSLFYEYAMESDNAFVREWYRFNLNVNNIQAAITARTYGLDMQKVIVGSDDIARALRTSGARDWGLSQELEYFEDVARLQEEDDLSQRERKTDLLRWRWLEDNSFFNYFSVEKLFSYMVRLGMVERWTGMDRERGQLLFRELIGSLKDQTEVPAEFK